MEKKLHHKALNASDDIGAVMASLLGLAGIFDVPAKLGITAEELAMALGFGFTILAFIRGRLEKRRREPVAVLATETPVPPSETPEAPTEDDATG